MLQTRIESINWLSATDWGRIGYECYDIIALPSPFRRPNNNAQHTGAHDSHSSTVWSQNKSTASTCSLSDKFYTKCSHSTNYAYNQWIVAFESYFFRCLLLLRSVSFVIVFFFCHFEYGAHVLGLWLTINDNLVCNKFDIFDIQTRSVWYYFCYMSFLFGHGVFVGAFAKENHQYFLFRSHSTDDFSDTHNFKLKHTHTPFDAIFTNNSFSVCPQPYSFSISARSCRFI